MESDAAILWTRSSERLGCNTMRRFLCLLVVMGSLTVDAAAQSRLPDLAAVFAAPITIERGSRVTDAPIEMRSGKIYLQARINDEAREFIFDTGSPSILSREFAQSLNLEIVGQNTGIDANGQPVTMDIAIVHSIEIGDTAFRNVPVLIFDFSELELGPCIFDGGVLGSEILPGSAWRIDTETETLSLAANVDDLPGGVPALRARLYDFGYPHAPIVDYSIGSVVDKALFDTGSGEVLALFERVADSPDVRRGIVADSLRSGRGSEGVSAGGQGAVVDLIRFNLSGFLVDGQPLGPVRAATRQAPPTLIGAGILDTYIVTLDYPGGAYLLESRREQALQRPEKGYAIGFVDQRATVTQLFDRSPAAEAGLQLGDHIVSAQGRPLDVSANNPICGSAMWLANEFNPEIALDMVVDRGGTLQTIHIPAPDR